MVFLPHTNTVILLELYCGTIQSLGDLCEWQFCEEFAPHPGGTNDNDAHACEPNYITVQNKIIAKILPVNKFTTLKFLSLLPSMNG